MTVQSSIVFAWDFLVGTARGIVCWMVPLAILWGALYIPHLVMALALMITYPGAAGAVLVILGVSIFIGFVFWLGNEPQWAGVIFGPIALGIGLWVSGTLFWTP